MFSDRIREARKELGVSQFQFAVKVGVSLQAVHSWEQGRTEPNLENLRKLSEVTGRSIDWFANGDHSELVA